MQQKQNKLLPALTIVNVRTLSNQNILVSSKNISLELESTMRDL